MLPRNPVHPYLGPFLWANWVARCTAWPLRATPRRSCSRSPLSSGISMLGGTFPWSRSRFPPPRQLVVEVTPHTDSYLWAQRKTVTVVFGSPLCIACLCLIPFRAWPWMPAGWCVASTQLAWLAASGSTWRGVGSFCGSHLMLPDQRPSFCVAHIPQTDFWIKCVCLQQTAWLVPTP